jgi:NTE family protein
MTTQRKKVGLALGGGVVRGLAHVGVLSALEAEGIPVDYVAGTSAGSLIGATYCAGLSVEEIKQHTLRMYWWHIARPVLSLRGFVNFDRLAKWLIDRVGDLHFSELKIPCAAMATDLESGKPVALSEGRVAPAVQASCSIPGFVVPVQIGNKLLGDGSISDTIPVDVLRRMGADYVIGVDIFASSIRRRLGPLAIGLAALEILIERAGGGIDLADCLIAPDVAGKTYFRFSKREEFFELGEKAAREKLPEIRAALGLSESSDQPGLSGR